MTTANRPIAGQADRLLPRLMPLCVVMFVGFLTVSLPLPALPLHVRAMGFGTALAGLAVGVQSFATILTRPAAGRMVDARGPKPTLLRGLLVASGAGWLYLASLLIAHPVPSLLVLLAGRLVLGAGESLLITGVLGWAIARAGMARAGRAMAWNGMAQYGSLALGAPAGFFVFQRFGFGGVAAATALLPLAAALVVWPLEPTGPSGGTRLPLRVVVGRIWQPGAGLMLAGIGFAAVSTFGSLFFAARDWPGAGWALFAYGACFVGVRVVASGLPDALGGARVAAVSMAVEAAGQALLWAAPSPAVALLGAGLTGAGCSLVFPALGVEAFKRVPPDQRGIAVGLFAAFQDLAIGSTGPVLGTVAAGAGLPAVFLLGGIAAAAGALVAARTGTPED